MEEKVFVLTEKDEERFNWKHYQKKFPTIRFIIALIEILLIALFVIIRFDYVYTIPGGTLLDGTILFYNFDESGNIVPFVVDQLAKEGTVVLNIFYNIAPSLGALGRVLIIFIAHYVEFMNSLFINGILPIDNALTTEIILIIVFTILLIIFTFAIGGTFAPIIRKNSAVKKAEKAKNNYIQSLKNQGYIISNQTNDIKPQQIDLPKVNVIEENITTYSTNYNTQIEYKSSNNDDIVYAPVGSEKEKIILSQELNSSRGIRKISNELPSSIKLCIQFSPLNQINNEIVNEPKDIEIKEYTKNNLIESKEENNILEEKPLDSNEHVKEETSVVEMVKQDKKEEVVELIKPIQPVKAAKKKTTTNKARKPIRPVDATNNNDDDKLNEYIIKTSDANQLAMNQEELESSTNTNKQQKKSSALTRNPTTRRKSISNKNTSNKKKVSSNKATSNKE